MNKRDAEPAAKLAARSLVEALHGLSVAAADQMLSLVELAIINGQTFHPDHIERYRVYVRGLPPGSALEAVRLARHVILNCHEVDMNAEGAVMAFNLWAKEAALAGFQQQAA